MTINWIKQLSLLHWPVLATYSSSLKKLKIKTKFDHNSDPNVSGRGRNAAVKSSLLDISEATLWKKILNIYLLTFFKLEALVIHNYT